MPRFDIVRVVIQLTLVDQKAYYLGTLLVDGYAVGHRPSGVY